MKKLLQKLESIVELKLIEVTQTKGVYAGSVSYDHSEQSDYSTSYDTSTYFDSSQSHDK